MSVNIQMSWSPTAERTHTHRLKWINAPKELCHLIYQQTSPSGPCLAGSEMGASVLIQVLGNCRQDSVLDTEDSRECSRPLLLPPHRPRECQEMSVRDSLNSLQEAASHWARLTHIWPSFADDFTNRLLQNWGGHQLLPGRQCVFVNL